MEIWVQKIFAEVGERYLKINALSFINKNLLLGLSHCFPV